jgi:hypothetical protein
LPIGMDRVIVRASSDAAARAGRGESAVRLLIVSYAFPPVGGVGVQRVTKLAKYLPEFGIAPTVLTAENPSVPVTDETLLRDIPASVEVFRTQTLEPGYRAKEAVWRSVARAGRLSSARGAFTSLARGLFVPDPQILWLPSAAPAFRRLSSRADAVLVSGPPFSPFLLGLLSRAPFVLDYRDEWRTAAAYEMHGGAFAARVIDAIEPVLVRRARKILTATEEFRENLLARHRELDPDNIVALPNGYDPDDFKAVASVPRPPAFRPGQKLVLTYAGTSFRLTSPRGFFAGLRVLEERAPHIAAELDVRFIGRVVETEKALSSAVSATGRTRRRSPSSGRATLSSAFSTTSPAWNRFILRRSSSSCTSAGLASRSRRPARSPASSIATGWASSCIPAIRLPLRTRTSAR